MLGSEGAHTAGPPETAQAARLHSSEQTKCSDARPSVLLTLTESAGSFVRGGGTGSRAALAASSGRDGAWHLLLPLDTHLTFSSPESTGETLVGVQSEADLTLPRWLGSTCGSRSRARNLRPGPPPATWLHLLPTSHPLWPQRETWPGGGRGGRGMTSAIHARE